MPATKNGFELQDDDVEILNDVYQLRLAELGHIAALRGRSEKALRRRLLKLARGHFLRPLRRFMQKNIYAVGKEGVHALVDAGYAERDVEERRLIRHNE